MFRLGSEAAKAEKGIQHNLWCFTWFLFMRCVGKHLLRLSRRLFSSRTRNPRYLSQTFFGSILIISRKSRDEKQVFVSCHGRLDPHFVFVYPLERQKVFFRERKRDSVWKMTLKDNKLTLRFCENIYENKPRLRALFLFEISLWGERIFIFVRITCDIWVIRSLPFTSLAYLFSAFFFFFFHNFSFLTVKNYYVKHIYCRFLTRLHVFQFRGKRKNEEIFEWNTVRSHYFHNVLFEWIFEGGNWRVLRVETWRLNILKF